MQFTDLQAPVENGAIAAIQHFGIESGRGMAIIWYDKRQGWYTVALTASRKGGGSRQRFNQWGAVAMFVGLLAESADWTIADPV